MPNISVSTYIHQRLEEIKIRDGHTSKDSVIRTLWLKDKGVTIVCRRRNCVYNNSENCTAQLIEVNGGCETFERKPLETRAGRISVSPIQLAGEQRKRESLY